MDDKQDTPPSMPGEDVESIPENIPEKKKTEKRVVFDQEIEEAKKHPETPRKKKKLTDVAKPAPIPEDHQHLPLELVLVRHGQSEGNEAHKLSKRGDLSAYTTEFKNRHSSAYRLTDNGIKQAKVAGDWIKDNIGDKFDRYYTSEFVRAMETASLLELPDPQWYTEVVLRERDKGVLDNMPWTEKNQKHKYDMELRSRDSFFWAPPGGESIANVCVRVDHTFNTLRRECSNKQRVIIVCHGEVMWAFRVRIERLSQIRYHQLRSSKDPKDSIHHAQILHYSRIHPTTGEVFPDFRFMRSACPWKPNISDEEWMEFDRPTYSNDELMQSVLTVPRYVNNRPEEVTWKPV